MTDIRADESACARADQRANGLVGAALGGLHLARLCTAGESQSCREYGGIEKVVHGSSGTERCVECFWTHIFMWT